MSIPLKQPFKLPHPDLANPQILLLPQEIEDDKWRDVQRRIQCSLYGPKKISDDIFGNVYLFDNIDDYIEIPFSIDPSKSGFSVFTAFKGFSFRSTSNNMVITHYNSPTSGIGLIFVYNGNNVVSRIGGSYQYSGLHPQVNKLYFIGWTYNKDTGRMQWYVNGRKTGKTTISYTSGPVKYLIGIWVNLVYYVFDGIIPFVSLYNRPLFPKEVWRLYNFFGGDGVFDPAS